MRTPRSLRRRPERPERRLSACSPAPRSPWADPLVRRAHRFSAATGAGSRGSCGRQSVAVPGGAAGLPPTHVGGYGEDSDRRSRTRWPGAPTVCGRESFSRRIVSSRLGLSARQSSFPAVVDAPRANPRLHLLGGEGRGEGGFAPCSAIVPHCDGVRVARLHPNPLPPGEGIALCRPSTPHVSPTRTAPRPLARQRGTDRLPR
jgi:hypothetical protein